MFSKLLRYLISPTLLICLIGSNCYSSERAYEDLKNERTPLIKRESDENFDKKFLIKKKNSEITIKKIEDQDIEAGYICINLDYNSDKDIKNYTKDKSIKSFSILVNSKNDASEHKKNF